MINRIYINRFHLINEVVINGTTHKYYYYDETNDVLILEECNDDKFFMYSIVNENGQLEYIGKHFGDIGIFDKDNNSLNLIEDNNGQQYVEVDTERCKIF